MNDIIKKVLFLEDDEFTRNIVTAQLNKAKLEVTPIGDLQALEQADYDTFDILLTDLNIDGVDVTPAFSRIKENAGLPVVVLSQSVVDGGVADLYLTKPLNQQKINKLLNLLSGEVEVDISQVENFACGDEGLLKTYVIEFVENYEVELHKLNQLMLEENLKAIADKAHKMLSSTHYYKYNPVVSTLASLEINAADSDVATVKQQVAQLNTASQDFISTLKAKVSTGKG